MKFNCPSCLIIILLWLEAERTFQNVAYMTNRTIITRIFCKWIETKYVNVALNCNSKVDEPANDNYSETGNNTNCGNYEQSQPTLELLSITELGFSIWATFPSREPELIRRTIFIRHRCSYFERMSQRLKWNCIEKKTRKEKCYNG